jgi:hypothetical protein
MTMSAAKDGGERSLDFIVIGTQKGGTTSLWQYLRGHPDVFLTRAKEAPFFIRGDAAEPGAFAAYMRSAFREAPAGALLGKATPDYMLGRAEVGVEMVAERIAGAAPDAKLVALLRDPIERALSNYAMELRREQERRSADSALGEQLTPEGLAAARRYPTFSNSYVIQGEYGRILEVFRSRFPAERIFVDYTQELARDPGALLDRVLAFLGLPPGHRPPNLGTRYFRGGTRKRVDAEAQAALFDYLRSEVLPHLKGNPRPHANAFDFFFETWNVIPDEAPPPLSPETRLGLEQHFREDAERLAALGVATPWVATWEENSRIPE